MAKPIKTCTIDGCEKELRARGFCPMHYYRWSVHGDPHKGARVRQPDECVADGCNREPKRRGLCTKHYPRWKRYGDTSVYRPDAKQGCDVEGCERKHYGRGYCSVHYTRWNKTGNPEGFLEFTHGAQGVFGKDNPGWIGDRAGYETVHARLRKERGKAAGYQCRHCGKAAEQWAYTHDDPGEKVGANGLAYSVRIEEFYIPLCIECHSRFDAEWRLARKC